MEILSKLTKIVSKSQKRVGRGIGSGVGGHTTGRGGKGDKVRGTTKLTFDGSKIKKSWIKRTPYLRGKHRVLAKSKPYHLRLDQIEKLFPGSEMIDQKLIAKKLNLPLNTTFKLLSAKSKLSKIYTYKSLLLSKPAKDQIVQVGGKID